MLPDFTWNRAGETAIGSKLAECYHPLIDGISECPLFWFTGSTIKDYL